MTTLRLTSMSTLHALAAVSLLGCPWLPNVVNSANKDVQDAIDALNSNSASWQITLKTLEGKLSTDAKSLLGDLSQISSRAIGQAGTQTECSATFVGDKVRDDLQRLLAKIDGKPVPMPTPAVCLPNPETVDMGNRPRYLALYGYNFDVGDMQVQLQSDSGVQDVTRWASVTTHYLVTVDVSSTSEIPLCNKQNRRLIFSAGGSQLAEVRVLPGVCPTAPPLPPAPEPKTAYSIPDYSCGGGIGGCSDNVTFGDACHEGYERTLTTVNHTDGDGHCEFVRWADPANPRDCRAVVHFGAPSFHKVHCTIDIREVQTQQPPVTPPCPCI
jgi:hypothetical protein